MRKEIESTFKRRWLARVCCGVLTFLTVLGVGGAYAEDDVKQDVAKDDVARAMKELEMWNNIAISARGSMIMRLRGQTLGSETVVAIQYEKQGGDASDLGAPSAGELIAAHFLHARETSDLVYSAVKSMKLIPFSGSSRSAVRVLFSDGSVRYYDEDQLDGEREPANAPSEETVTEIGEYVFELSFLNDSIATLLKKRLRAMDAPSTEATK